jgi:hypothetical protein
MEREKEKKKKRERDRDRDKARAMTFDFRSIENNMLSSRSNARKSHHRRQKR